MKPELLQGEELLKTSDGDRVILTNKRFRVYRDSDYGSIPLSKISIIEVAFIEKLFYVPLAILSGLILVFQLMEHAFGNEVTLLSGVGLIVFTVLYFISRKHVVSVTSDSGIALSFTTKGMGEDDINTFVTAIEQNSIK